MTLKQYLPHAGCQQGFRSGFRVQGAHRIAGRQRVLEQVGAPQVAVVGEQRLAAARHPVDAREGEARACSRDAAVRDPSRQAHVV